MVGGIARLDPAVGIARQNHGEQPGLDVEQWNAREPLALREGRQASALC
jgi:hypothetical protein